MRQGPLLAVRCGSQAAAQNASGRSVGEMIAARPTAKWGSVFGQFVISLTCSHLYSTNACNQDR